MKSIFMVMPTWNNAAMCAEAIRTLYEYTDFERYGELLIVDNSPEASDSLGVIAARYGVRVHWPGVNLGWMGGVNYGIESIGQMPFFTMCNDDVVFPQDRAFWPRTLKLFEDPKVGGVGPISNYAMGWQYHRVSPPGQIGEVNLLVGFCATYRTEMLRAIGLLDVTLPGGDDFDLSIRVRAAGYKLLCDRRSFLYHYGSATGLRLHNDWDSLQSQHKTLNAIAHKHGMKAWYHTVQGPWITYLEAEQSGVSEKTLEIVAREITDLGAALGARGISWIEGSCTVKQIEFIIEHTRGAADACETGFNAGMSACTMLAANPSLWLASFDIGRWDCVEPAAEYLRKKFGDRLDLCLGDSRRTLPSRIWTMAFFDFTLIDGGHDYETAYSDLKYLAPRSRKIMMDDIRMPGVRRAWDQAVSEGLVTSLGEYMDMDATVPRFWALGLGGVK